ncbi:hypothetical protein HMPREF0345_0457, partial [Enterococcus faecalis ATCC 29200]
VQGEIRGEYHAVVEHFGVRLRLGRGGHREIQHVVGGGERLGGAGRSGERLRSAGGRLGAIVRSAAGEQEA